ncbi:MAG: hypothetical protein J6W64_08080 [Bacilli bacterium]|nr:hypothetical protein [Bacilli bacterium]
MTDAIILQEKIVKKKTQLEKLVKKLSKLTSERDDESKFLAKYSTWYGFEDRRDEFKKYWIDDHDYDIGRCLSDINSTNEIITKYTNMLLLAQERESKPVIGVLKDFLDHWKEEIQEYTANMYSKFLDIDKKYCGLSNDYSRYGDPARDEELDELRKQRRFLLSIAWVSIRRDCRSVEKFNEYLDKYMKDRYYELVAKITKDVGEIEDVTHLRVGPDGRLNGIVEGSKGKAELETIVAGGYNENIIVNVKHGQCAHYRVLVKKLKK